jgi:hypothetical protein
MKKVKWSYLILIVVGLIATVYFSCNRTHSGSLRIVKINEGSPRIIDIADHGIEVDPETHDTTYTYHIAPDQVIPVEFSYVETGIGLPTYPTDYTAYITDYKVQFSAVGHPQWHLQSVSGATNITIPSNPTATVKAGLMAIPSEWMHMYFDSIIADSGVIFKATLSVSGYEELTRNAIADTGFFTIDIRDSYDDPFKFGSK